jgi:hypothetical protein
MELQMRLWRELPDIPVGSGDGNTNDQPDTAPNYSGQRGFGLLALALALSCAACGQSRDVLLAFRTEQQAQEHCPNDIVVWLDPQTGTYQLKGHGSYGLSAAGRYACRSEADGAGMHAIAK